MVKTERVLWGKFDGWRVRVTPARSIATPAVWEGRVIFGGGFGSHEMYAVYARTGEPAWEIRTKDDGPTAPTVIDGLAFLNTESCTLEAIQIASGTLLWEKWLGDPLLAQPAGGDGRVLMVWPNQGKHFLGAFEIGTGRPLWETEIAADIISAPVIFEGKAYVTTYDGAVTCTNLATGTRLWSKPMQATSAPWINGDALYVAHRAEMATPHERAASRANRNNDSETWERTSWLDTEQGHEVWASDPKLAMYLSDKRGLERKRAFMAEDAAVGFAHSPASAKTHLAQNLISESSISRMWRYQGSRPCVVDGVLFEAVGDRLEATELASTTKLWSWGNAEEFEGERRFTPPAVANGRVLIGTWDGRLVSLEAATGKVRWQVPVGAPVHWQPVMSGGRVFAGLEDGSVICVDTRDPGDDGWAMWGGGPGHNGAVARSPVEYVNETATARC